MKLVIDRFEGEFAVCERPDRSMLNILKTRIPKGAVEGTVLNLYDDGNIKINIDETRKRKIDIQKLMSNLFM
ncbi:DUF3006 domain-containing protein [Clostridium felsineum]|nr:DUF3006 domain-containing protein [Clostridium felsineum]